MTELSLQWSFFQFIKVHSLWFLGIWQYKRQFCLSNLKIKRTSPSHFELSINTIYDTTSNALRQLHIAVNMEATSDVRTMAIHIPVWALQEYKT